jgi:hypothetical protein
MAIQKERTEHAGAKNGGGFWGTRAEAKESSKVLRRINGRRQIREELKREKCYEKEIEE